MAQQDPAAQQKLNAGQNLTGERNFVVPKDPPQQPDPKVERIGRRLCVACLAALLGVGCIAGTVLMIWSYHNEKDGPRLLYALSPVTFLLFSALIQLLVLGLHWPTSIQRQKREDQGRQVRLNPQLLIVGFVLGICVSLLHIFSSLIGKISVLPPATSWYDVIHESILAVLATGVAILLALLAHRLSHLDD